MRISKARHQKKKSRLSVLAALGLLTMLALLLSNGAVTMAKFMLEKRSTGAYVAAPFYFVSDKLSEASPYPYYHLEEPGEGEEVAVQFRLYNHVDDLRWAKEDITYTCTVETGTGEVVDRARAKASGQISSGRGGSATVTLYLMAADLADGPVTVKAEASPYKKTLCARYGFALQDDGLQWDVEELDGAVVLDVAGGDGTTLTVQWPESLVPDPSAGLLQNVSGTGGEFTPASGVRYSLVFLRADPADPPSYQKSDFQIRERTAEP